MGKTAVLEKTPDLTLAGNNVLIRLIEPERMSHGLHIPETAKRADYEVFRGVVVATGPGSLSKYGTLTPCDVRPGDVVVFYWFGNEDSMQWPDADHRIISEDFIQYVEEQG